MKFGDKLIQLRKKNGLSQEELAAKLNVSRQSVSKWESNNTYPETDKIVQICNIFDCTMDDLINENIKDITMIERSSKSQLNINIDSLLDFITKTINMFCNMKFFSLLKCLIEQSIIICILIVVGLIVNSVLTSVIRGIFSFLPWEVLRVIESIIESVLMLVWIIISVIIVVHIFKIRYLNYYEEIINNETTTYEDGSNDDNSDKNNSLEDDNKKSVKVKKEKIKLENREPRIVIRDKEPFPFLNSLARMILWFIKFLVAMIGLFFAFILLLGVIGLVLSISLSVYSKIFIGLDIAFIGALIAIVLILILLFHFILDSKVNVKLDIFLFFLSIIVMGIGIGVSLVFCKDLKVEDDLNDILEVSMQEEELSFVDNMIIIDSYPRTYEYIIDNSLNDEKIIIKNEFDPRFYKLVYYDEVQNGMNLFSFHLNARVNINEVFKIVMNDLKNNIIRDYSLYLEGTDIKIVANDKTVNKLINNFSKIYNYKKDNTDNGFIIYDISRKIKNITSECYGEYNVLTKSFNTIDERCSCVFDKNSSDLIEYSCYRKDE